MPLKGHGRTVVRAVEGLSGEVPMRMELVIRFDYGSTIPWVESWPTGTSAVAGPDALYLRTEVETRGEGLTTVADFTVREGEVIPFTLTWAPPTRRRPRRSMRSGRSATPSTGGRNGAAAASSRASTATRWSAP